MTRILACSDIHNNVNAVRQLRATEGNDYDALIVAGDIGSETASEIFEVFQTFECPVLYIFGNWDHRLEHDMAFGERCHHVHISPYSIGDLSIIGETIDGIDPNWEALRGQIEASAPADVPVARKAYIETQREKLSAIVAGGCPERTVVVSHYRLTKTQNTLPGVPLFLFGHIHRFQDTNFRGQRFVNVSALDNKVMVAPRGTKRISRNDYRLLNDGSYVVITHDRQAGFSVKPRRLNPDFANWIRIEGIFDRSAAEVKWDRNISSRVV